MCAMHRAAAMQRLSDAYSLPIKLCYMLRCIHMHMHIMFLVYDAWEHSIDTVKGIGQNSRITTIGS